MRRYLGKVVAAMNEQQKSTYETETAKNLPEQNNRHNGKERRKKNR